MFSHIKPEQLNDYRAITVEGKTIYANADLTRFYNVTPDPNGQLILSQNFEYLTVDDLSLLQLVKDPHQG